MPPLPRVRDLRIDHLHKLPAHEDLSHQQLPVATHRILPVQSRQVLEDVHHISAQQRVAAEEGKVRVQARGHGVVVAGADVDVPAE